MTLTLTDLFCGAGGSSTGAKQVEGLVVDQAANHWALAILIHKTNHPDTDHAVVDLHQENPRYFRRTDFAWFSPECTKWTGASGDAAKDDPTIVRCRNFAKALGATGLAVVNLYAYRATKPADLWKVVDPVGPENDEALTMFLDLAARHDFPIIAAWGANARPNRVSRVLALPGAERLTALGVTKDGAPRHPLYLRADSTPVPWRPAGEASWPS